MSTIYKVETDNGTEYFSDEGRAKRAGGTVTEIEVNDDSSEYYLVSTLRTDGGIAWRVERCDFMLSHFGLGRCYLAYDESDALAQAFKDDAEFPRIEESDLAGIYYGGNNNE